MSSLISQRSNKNMCVPTTIGHLAESQRVILHQTVMTIAIFVSYFCNEFFLFFLDFEQMTFIPVNFYSWIWAVQSDFSWILDRFL